LPKLTTEEYRAPSLPRLSQAYSVLAKTQGKFKVIGAGLPLGKALSQGVGFTAHTAARSFKLVPSGFTGQPDINAPSLSNYYGRGGVLIERTKYAINTPGELREITYKGIAANKFKKFGRLRGLL
jgi:hypothetical protein